MTFLAIALGLAQAQNPTTLHSRVISAAIFKPGLAMLVREVEVPAGSGFYALDELPDAIDGSFWFGSPDDALVSDVNTTIRLQDDSKTYDAKTIPELIYANVGKHMSMKVYRSPSELESVAGTVVNLDERDGNTTLKLDGGNMRSVPISQIIELDPAGLSTSYTRKGKVPTLHVQFKASASKAAHVRFTTMEPGAAWNASYLVDLGNDSAARVEGKAQLGLGGLKFEDTDTRLMAGFPNLPTTNKFDLAAGFGSLDEYLHGGERNFAGFRPGTPDPYDFFGQWLQRAEQALARFVLGTYNPGYGGGGFGGGAFVVDGTQQGVNGVFAGTTPGSFIRTGNALPADTSIFRSESLYAYPIGPTTLEPGDRLTRLLFEQASHYRTIYHWDAESGNNPVEQYVRVHNDGKTPWTGGVVTISKTGIPLAQTDMPFTAVEKDADLALGKAPDVLMDKDVQETKAEQIPNPNRKAGENLHVRLTEETQMSATNTKDEAITLEIVLTLAGDVTAPGAKVEKLPRRYGDLNAKVHLTWTLQLGPGEQKKISCTNTYIR
ncbi:MAG: hypothetical protein ACHQ50_07405 [Fimbriimonadales bacterium]